jgi:hypothetical protein
MGFGHLAAQFERRNRLLAPDGREILQELIKRVAGFEVVVERLYGHASAGKNRSSTQDFAVAVNYDLIKHLDAGLSDQVYLIVRADMSTLRRKGTLPVQAAAAPPELLALFDELAGRVTSQK